MTILELFQLSQMLLKSSKTDPNNHVFCLKSGKHISAQKAIEAYELLIDWVCPELSMEDVSLIVHCKDCEHFRKFRRKGGDYKAEVITACRYDKNKRDPEFFCKWGERRAQSQSKQGDNHK